MTMQTKSQLLQLELENEQLRNIILFMPGNVFWKGRDGRYQGCNANMAKIFGCHPNDFINTTAYDLLGPETAELAKKIDDEDIAVMVSGKESLVEEHYAGSVFLSRKKPIFA